MLTIHAAKGNYIVNLWSSDGEKVGGAIGSNGWWAVGMSVKDVLDVYDVDDKMIVMVSNDEQSPELSVVNHG